MLAVHVDDVRLIARPQDEERLKHKLNSLFSFGEWNCPRNGRGSVEDMKDNSTTV